MKFNLKKKKQERSHISKHARGKFKCILLFVVLSVEYVFSPSTIIVALQFSGNKWLLGVHQMSLICYSV